MVQPLRMHDDCLKSLLACWPEDPTAFAKRCAAVSDWEGLVARAECHGILGILAGPLASPAHSWCPHAADAIEQREVIGQVWGAWCLETLDEILGVLARAGIRAAVLKGPVLSERLYGDPCTR